MPWVELESSLVAFELARLDAVGLDWVRSDCIGFEWVDVILSWIGWVPKRWISLTRDAQWCESTLLEDGSGGALRAVSEVSPQIYDFLRFLAIWRVEFAVFRQFRGRHPLEIILDLLRNAIKSKIRAKFDCSNEFFSKTKKCWKNYVRRKFHEIASDWNFETKWVWRTSWIWERDCVFNARKFLESRILPSPPTRTWVGFLQACAWPTFNFTPATGECFRTPPPSDERGGAASKEKPAF